jgi:hypothetical protein
MSMRSSCSVCDPFVDDRVIKQLIALHEKTRKPIVASSDANTLGLPALFEHVCFREVLSINDQRGAKSSILASRERVAELSLPKGKIEVDTAEDWERLKNGVLTQTPYNSFPAEEFFEGLEELVREGGCFSAKIIELLGELQFLAAVNFAGDGRHFIGG